LPCVHRRLHFRGHLVRASTLRSLVEESKRTVSRQVDFVTVCNGDGNSPLLALI
jgi:hypothetical protein